MKKLKPLCRNWVWDQIAPNTLVKTEWDIACGKK
jgi:hypothetical protein